MSGEERMSEKNTGTPMSGMIGKVTERKGKTDHTDNTGQDVGKEKQMLYALCINYTAAYCCDLMKDEIESIKQKDYSHSANSRGKLQNQSSYSEWIRYTYDHVIVRESAPDYLEVFDAENLMQRLRREESFVYPHRTVPNSVGMEYFEATIVKVYEEDDSFKVIIGYRPIDDILKKEKFHQQKLEKALQAAEIANRTKTEFLRRMSHDIRTPLNGIIGLLDIDENHFDDIARVKENHEKMRISANHLLSLINDVLQMSKLEDGSIEFAHEPIGLIELTKDIVNIVVDRAIESGIRWQYERGKTEIPYPYIYGSPLHLRQIFLNIYGNCIKYNRPGGSITTVVDALGVKDGICTYRWTISDTGVGMSREFLEHIFEPFAQEKSDARSIYQGTGLGMAIVKNLVDQMGGSISVKSQEGIGTTFEIILPFEIAPAPEKLSEQQKSFEHSIYGLHLLLAEDNALNAEIAEVLLTDKGAKVSVVADGEQAIKQFASNRPGTFDAILMDIMMPVMDGITATRRIRSLDRADAKTIPIIAMTANAFEEDARQCLEAGMDAHLAKPLQIEKVIDEIARCCDCTNEKKSPEE